MPARLRPGCGQSRKNRFSAPPTGTARKKYVIGHLHRRRDAAIARDDIVVAVDDEHEARRGDRSARLKKSSAGRARGGSRRGTMSMAICASRPVASAMPRNTAQQKHQIADFLRPGQAGVEAVAQHDLQAGDGDRAEHQPDAERLERSRSATRARPAGDAIRRRRSGGGHLAWTLAPRLSPAARICSIISAVSGLFDPNSSNSGAVSSLHLGAVRPSADSLHLDAELLQFRQRLGGVGAVDRALLGEDFLGRVAHQLRRSSGRLSSQRRVDAHGLGQEPVAGQRQVLGLLVELEADDREDVGIDARR